MANILDLQGMPEGSPAAQAGRMLEGGACISVVSYVASQTEAASAPTPTSAGRQASSAGGREAAPRGVAGGACISVISYVGER